MKVKVLGLYSLMDPDKQMKIFEKIENNVRLIVISTNIAEMPFLMHYKLQATAYFLNMLNFP